jgi:hypothetical protein
VGDNIITDRREIDSEDVNLDRLWINEPKSVIYEKSDGQLSFVTEGNFLPTLIIIYCFK